MKRFSLLAALALSAFAGPALAQHAVPITANQTVADGQLVPVLTWTSTPQGPTSCTASGGWSGTKAGAGTETLPRITANAVYHLDCVWPGTTGTATVSWTAPTHNTNGTVLTDLAGFDVVRGTSPTALGATTNVANPAARSQLITGLAAGRWHFGILAYNANGARSALSNIADVVVTSNAPTARGSVSITIRPVPNPPVLTTVTLTAAATPYVPVYRASGASLGTTVYGFVPTGRRCGNYVRTWRGKRWHLVEVERNELWATEDPSSLAAPCA